MSENTTEAQEQTLATAPPLDKKDVKRVLEIHRFMHKELSQVEIFPEEYRGMRFILNWLKSSYDENTKFEVAPGLTALDLKKIHHDNYATVSHMMSTRCKHFTSSMGPIVEAIGFANEMAKQLKSEIEIVEPPKKEEKAPFEMDLTHITNKKPEEVIQ